MKQIPKYLCVPCAIKWCNFTSLNKPPLTSNPCDCCEKNVATIPIKFLGRLSREYKKEWEKDRTIVIFRKLKGEVIACFPTIPGTNNPNTMSGYVHIGQHTIIDSDVGRRAKLATKKEYEPLMKELESIGYKLNIKYRSCHQYRDKRIEALKNERLLE
jgi:hypothetical protein